MSAAVYLPGPGAFDAAVLAAVKLSAVARGQNDTLIESRRRETIAAFERLVEAGLDSAWLRRRIAHLHDDVMWRVYWAAEGVELFQRLGELAALDESVAASISRPASPPPPSGDGDEEAQEAAAARAVTGDTLPPESGDVPLGWMACAGPDTEPPLADAACWDDPEKTLVPV